MPTPNLAHLRATACPYYPQEGIQQIVIYGRTENAAEEATSEERREPPICCVTVEFTDPAEQCQGLLSRLQAEFGERVNSDDLFIFSRYDLEWLAEASRSNFSRRIRGVKWLDEGGKPLERFLPPCHRTAPRRSTFVMACCIYDKPGTMYNILRSLNSPKGQEVSPGDFDLNVDYMRTEDLRIGDYYSFEIYGTYTNSPHLANEENVCGVVFYSDFSQNDGLTDWVKKAMESRLGLKKVEESELQKHWRELYEFGSAENLPAPKDFLGYRNDKINRGLPSVRQCPISRIVKCPIPRKKKPKDQPGGSRARIGVLLHDVPGALISSLDLLGKL